MSWLPLTASLSKPAVVSLMSLPLWHTWAQDLGPQAVPGSVCVSLPPCLRSACYCEPTEHPLIPLSSHSGTLGTLSAVGVPNTGFFRWPPWLFSGAKNYKIWTSAWNDKKENAGRKYGLTSQRHLATYIQENLLHIQYKLDAFVHSFLYAVHTYWGPTVCPGQNLHVFPIAP